MLQALALEEDEIPEIKDETLPDEEGMARYEQGFHRKVKEISSFFLFTIGFVTL